jgi:hypothetical protein
MRYTITFSEGAIETIETCQLEGETFEACVNRLLENLRAIAPDYEEFFGPQPGGQVPVSDDEEAV